MLLISVTRTNYQTRTIVKHALSISVDKIDYSNHQQNRHHEAGFVDFRCDYRLRDAASVDFHTDFSYENRHRETLA